MPENYFVLAGLGLAMIYFAINVPLDPSKTKLQKVLGTITVWVVTGLVVYGIFFLK